MHDPLYLGLELGAAAFFVWAALASLRSGRLPFFELLSAAVFGILLEEGDQLIFETYHYSSNFVLTLDRAPIVIGLTWALIIAGAMRITDALGVRRRYAPFVDAVLAISLDLAFDAIAIRVGLWTWRGIGADRGLVRCPRRQLLRLVVGDARLQRPDPLAPRVCEQPAAARLAAAGAADPGLRHPARRTCTVRHPASDRRSASRRRALALRRGTRPGFVAVAAYGVFGPDRAEPNGERLAIVELRVAFASRIAIHGFFLGALIVLGLAPSVPVLVVVALVLLAAELPLARLASGPPRSTPTHDRQRTDRPRSALAEVVE